MSNVTMPANANAFSGCPNAVFYGWDAPYSAESETNASIPTYCNTNSRTYVQLKDFDSCTVSGLEAGKSYRADAAATLAPTVTAADGTTVLTAGTDYSLSYQMKDDDKWVDVENTNKAGDYRAVFTANLPYYGEDKTIEFSVYKWDRLSGTTALDTMQAITLAGFADDSCDSVIVATIDGYWDALSASSLAGQEKCPVLLTATNSLSSQTKADIERLGASTVYIVGGTAAVSSDVEKSIAGIKDVKTVTRLSGDNAIGTALDIYEEGTKSEEGWGDTAIIATSETFQDALSASPYAYAQDAPIFLTNASTHTLDSETAAELNAGGFTRVLICGGTAAISDDVLGQIRDGISVERCWGETCYETSSRIATFCVDNGMSANGMGVATGESYYDALTGAALCGKNGSALVLVSDTNRNAIDWFGDNNKNSVIHGYVFGGTAAVSKSTFDYLASAIQ